MINYGTINIRLTLRR